MKNIIALIITLLLLSCNSIETVEPLKESFTVEHYTKGNAKRIVIFFLDPPIDSVNVYYKMNERPWKQATHRANVHCGKLSMGVVGATTLRARIQVWDPELQKKEINF